MYEKQTVDAFLHRIDCFVSDLLKDCRPSKSGDKVIHDPIWGSVVYHAWEIQLIDTPLLQRLRGISQLGMASLTYPAARHSRYEHSLGTVAIASRMAEKLLNEKAFSGLSYQPGEEVLYLVRLAALLHDVGHCAYSHLSETVYGNLPEFLQLQAYLRACYGADFSAKPHEIFSYLILTSNAFYRFFSEWIDYPKKEETDCRELLLSAAKMVVGVDNFLSVGGKTYRLSFLTDILNGDFDADKLDYTQRDSYTAGIAMTYGVERFLMKLVVMKKETDGYTDIRLAMRGDSMVTVEELLFNRSVLYHYMYRHKKVLATEAVIRDIFYSLLELGEVRHPCDFLRLSDNDIEHFLSSDRVPFPALAPDRTLRRFSNMLKKRDLPKACLIVGKNNLRLKKREDTLLDRLLLTAESLPKDDREEKLVSEFEEICGDYIPEVLLSSRVQNLCRRISRLPYSGYMELRRCFYGILCEEYQKAGRTVDFDLFDLHISLMPFSESRVRFPLCDANGETYSSDLSYVRRWIRSFSWDKWKGLFYAADHIDRRIAGKAAAQFFSALAPDLEIV